MSKKHFIELADMMRELRTNYGTEDIPYDAVLNAMCDFCKSQNPRFMEGRWIAYINGECGKNGGSVKKAA